LNRELTDKIKQMLVSLGLREGDTVFVHAGIGQIAAMLGHAVPVSVSDTLNAFHAALMDTVGASGTLAAPGFFYDYARKNKPYIVESSPPDRRLGFYPMHLLKQDGCKRSLNPIANVLAVGKNAADICAHTSAFAYGTMSPWARLVDYNAKGLVIGLPFMMTFIHHVEALVGPPHIYNKIFKTPVVAEGKPIELPVIASVRYLNYDIGYKDDKVEALLRNNGVMAEANRDGVQASVTRLQDIQRLLMPEIAKNTSFTLKSEPVFSPGELPDDGFQG